jgi:hypothetical protein
LGLDLSLAAGWLSQSPPANKTFNDCRGASKYCLLILTIIALYLDELRGQNLSLHQIELACPKACAVMSLFTDITAVSKVQSLDGLVASRHFGELALISYSIGPKLLPRNMRHRGGSAFSHSLHCLGGVFFTEWTESVKLFWHLHFLSSLNLHFKC